MKSIILKNSKFDTTYIRRWLKEFDATVKGKDFLNCFEKILEELRAQNEDR